MDRYKVTKMLGDGSFGSVLKAQNKETKEWTEDQGAEGETKAAETDKKEEEKGDKKEVDKNKKEEKKPAAEKK